MERERAHEKDRKEGERSQTNVGERRGTAMGMAAATVGGWKRVRERIGRL